MSTLEKVRSTMLYAELKDMIRRSKLSRAAWIFCPGHTGVAGNERADVLASEAVIGELISLDPPTAMTTEWLSHLPTPLTL